MTYGWTKAQEAELRALARNQSLFATEIAEMIGRNAQTVREKLRGLGFDLRARSKRSGRMGQWNAKHRHLRAKALRYYQTHSFEQTAERFGLTRSEMKSLLTVSYCDPKLAHLRKDTRRHDVWSGDELLFLLRHAGLQPRTWIARKLKRGGMHSVKESISRLGTTTRYINGLPRRLAVELLGREIEGFKVKAGPTGPGVDCRPIIVPWVVLAREARRSDLPDHIKLALDAMARFQKLIHGTRGVDSTIASVKTSIRGRR